ncbi:hypothetical protein DSECCO2_584240 [anaerobic digester metagenome]|jgi:hypothetical protein|nr:L-lactate dehydrogenase [Petrimonas sp. IBARAKI]
MIKVCPGREKEIILKKFTDRCFKCVKGIASGSYSFGPVAVLLMNITRWIVLDEKKPGQEW